MKLTILFVYLASLAGVFASSSYAQETKLSIEMKNAPVKEFLKEIENQSEFSFAYDNKAIDVERKVNADFKEAGINLILSSLFDNDQVSYYVFDRHIVLVRNDLDKSKRVLTIKQEPVVRGTVTDESGEPLIGVNVVIKGTTRGVITDVEGNYEITVPDEDAVLVFSYVGFVTKEIRVGNKSVIDVELTSALTELEELVVIGYGTQKKTDVTGAVSTVRIEDMQKVASNNAAVSLQGQVAGVNVVQSNADPGAGADIRIRGIGTLNNHFPLVIVDGVPSDINAVDPKDIESINILKDAASAAIYGSRAANGVVIINTKRGISGAKGKTQVGYRGYVSSNSREKDFGLIDNAPDFIKTAKLAADNSGSEYPLFVTMYDENPDQFGNTDWENAIFRSALEHKHELSISRSGDDFNFYVSAGYKEEEGIRLGSDDKQFSIRVNSDYKVSEKLKIGQSFGYTVNDGSRWDNRYFFWALIQANPLQKIYDPSTPSGYGERLREIGFKESTNLVQDAEEIVRTYKNDLMLASAYLEFEPVKNLKYLFRISQNYSRDTRFNFSPQSYTDENTYRSVSEIWERYGNGIHNIMDHILSYNLELGNHTFGALAGYSRESNKYHWFSGEGKNTPSNSIQNLGGAPQDKGNDGGDWEYRLLSQFGRLTYAFDNRYLVQANVRRDGSSRFAEENRWGVFPSVSLGWRLSEESFFESAKDFMNHLKLRASYGSLGMQEVGNYTYIPTILTDHSGLTNYPFGPGPSQPIFIGARQVSFPSVDLRWETTKSTNIGVDMGLFANRFTLEADYYIKNVEDILYAVPIPLSAGSNESPPVNAASIKNQGFELLAGWRKYEGNFKYNFRMTFATNTNEVIKLGNIGTEAIVGGAVYWALNDVTRTEVGTELGEFYLFETDGLFQTQGEIDSYTGPTGDPIMPDAEPGDLKIKDTNGDGEISNDDKVFMGSGLPKAEMSLTFNSSFKNFDLNMFLYSSLGVKKYNGGRWMASMAEEYHGWHKDMLDSWTPENTDTDIPRLVTDASHFNVRESDLYLENATYLRIKHIELGYNLPHNLINRVGVSNFRIYIGAENLLTITKYKGWDPGIGGGGDSFASGIDRYPYPVARKAIVGVQVSF